MYAMLQQFLVTFQTEIFSTLTSDFLKQMLILKSFNFVLLTENILAYLGWSGGAIELGQLYVPRRPANLNNSRARTYCTCNRCGIGLFGHVFFSHLSFCFFLPFWETARYRLKYTYCLKETLNVKQPTNAYSYREPQSVSISTHRVPGRLH